MTTSVGTDSLTTPHTLPDNFPGGKRVQNFGLDFEMSQMVWNGPSSGSRGLSNGPPKDSLIVVGGGVGTIGR